MMILNTNDILYNIQKSLNLTHEEILEAYKLEMYEITSEHLHALLSKKQDKAFKDCSHEELGVFLDGLIALKRGIASNKQSSNEVLELNNNLILKKLRIALELKDPQMEIIFNLADITLSKQELKSLFRKNGHKNFKLCSDILLKGFLTGLDEFYYASNILE